MNDFENQNFHQPTNTAPYMSKPEMGIKDWIITFLIMSIPCVGFIMTIIWAFSEENKIRSNYCKAWLIWSIGVSILVTIVYILFFAAFIGSYSW